MDYSELFPGRFLKATEFKGKNVTLTITDVVMEDLPQDKGGMKAKGVVVFKETKRQLVLNRTNAECIKGMFGRETDHWKGKRITLWPAPFRDPFTGENTVAIRLMGSPDLKADLGVEVRLPRKGPVKMMMKATGAKPQQKGAQPPPPPAVEEPPPFDPDTGEIPPDDLPSF